MGEVGVAAVLGQARAVDRVRERRQVVGVVSRVGRRSSVRDLDGVGRLASPTGGGRVGGGRRHGCWVNAKVSRGWKS
jgi:hypothetical protein